MRCVSCGEMDRKDEIREPRSGESRTSTGSTSPALPVSCAQEGGPVGRRHCHASGDAGGNCVTGRFSRRRRRVFFVASPRPAVSPGSLPRVARCRSASSGVTQSFQWRRARSCTAGNSASGASAGCRDSPKTVTETTKQPRRDRGLSDRISLSPRSPFRTVSAAAFLLQGPDTSSCTAASPGARRDERARRAGLSSFKDKRGTHHGRVTASALRSATGRVARGSRSVERGHPWCYSVRG